MAVVTLLGLLLPGFAPSVSAQDNVDGNIYISPNFGYELEWDEDVWEVDDEQSNRRDFLSLVETDGTSLVYVEGYEEYNGDPEDCLAGSSDEILNLDGVSDAKLLEDENGDAVEGDDNGVFFVGYSFVLDTDNGPQDEAGYFTCQTLVEGEAVLAFSFVGALDQFEDDLPVWTDLIAGLTLPDAADSGDESSNDQGSDDQATDDEGSDDQATDDEGSDDQASDDQEIGSRPGDEDADSSDNADAGDDNQSASGDAAGSSASFGGGPSHTGVQPGPAPADEPAELWTFETGDDFVGANAATVSVDDGLMFTSSNAVYAVDIETGEQVWTYESEANVGFVAPLALADGVLYAAGEDGSVYAFEPDSGDIIWQSEVTDGLPVNGGPLVVDDKLYVTAWDGNVYALETETGDLIGDTPMGGMSFGQPTYADRYLVMSAPSNGVLALPLDNGEDWLFETDGPVYAAPIVVDGVVYAGSDDGNLYALELESGDELWSVDTGAPINAALATSDGVVYVVNGDAVLGAYDTESGDELWTSDVDDAEIGGISLSETEDGDLLILVGDGDGVLHALDADGEEVYAADVTNAAIFWPATIIDGTIYVSARDGSVYALSADA
jgi:outer membrane protein assembly factor BamB